MRSIWITCVFFISMVAVCAQPPRFNYQGKLTDSNSNPLTGSHDLFFTLWHGGNNISGGTQVFQETATLNAVNGVVNHPVGTGQNQAMGALTASMLGYNGDIFLQVAVDLDTNIITPRTRLESVPFAIKSADGDARKPIDPPASFPIIISESGSYYLTGNITGIGGAEGILVTADDVTIDLNGYSLTGAPVSGSGVFLQSAPVQCNRLTVINGTIKGWTANGVNAEGALGCTFRNLKIDSNRGYGIYGGSSALVESCIATSNGKVGGAAGIYVLSNSIVRNCTSMLNSPDTIGSTTGFFLGVNSLIRDCTAQDNDASSGNATGIDAANNCTIINNSVYSNNSAVTGTGINGGSGNTIIGNTVTNNGSSASGNGFGIISGDQSNVLDNVCRANQGAGAFISRGIQATAGSRVERNNCTGHTGGTAGYGIHVSAGAGGITIIKNSTSGNSTAGIRFEGGTNYCAENLIDEVGGISNPGTNVMGTGDRTNILY